MIATKETREHKLSDSTYIGEPIKESKLRMVFFHGMWGCSAQVRALVEDMAGKGIEAFAINLHGHSNYNDAVPSDTLTNMGIEDYVTQAHRDLCEITSRFGDKPLILVGHSMGGKIVQKLAEEFTTKWLVSPLKGVVLLAPAPPTGIPLLGPIMFKIWKYLPKILTGRIFRLTDQDAADLLWNAKREPIWQTMYGETLPLRYESGKAALDGLKDSVCFWSKEPNPQILRHVPMLIMGGKQDRMIIPWVVEKIAKRYPHATLEWSPGDHMFPFCAVEAEGFVIALLEWMHTELGITGY